MTPELQFAESVKYTARQIVIIPVNDCFVIMEAYGTQRNPICTIPSGELARWAADDFARQRSCRAKAMKPRPPIVDFDLIDIVL